MMQCRAQFGSPLLRGILLSSISMLNAFQSYVGAALPKKNNEDVFFLWQQLREHLQLYGNVSEL